MQRLRVWCFTLVLLMMPPWKMEVCGQNAQTQVADSTDVYVVRHRWHAGIVLRRAEVPAEVWPEQQDFPEATYLEVGWGDASYYQSPDPGVGKALKAGLWPTPSVLHVVGFSRPVAAFFSSSEIIRLTLSAEHVINLATFIHDAYARDEEGQPVSLGPGLYGDSRFYEAQPRYHAFNNCNTWVARAFKRAGIDVSLRVVTVEQLMAQLRTSGEVIQEREGVD